MLQESHHRSSVNNRNGYGLSRAPPNSRTENHPPSLHRQHQSDQQPGTADMGLIAKPFGRRTYFLLIERSEIADDQKPRIAGMHQSAARSELIGRRNGCTLAR